MQRHMASPLSHWLRWHCWYFTKYWNNCVTAGTVLLSQALTLQGCCSCTAVVWLMFCFSCRFLQWSWRTTKERRLQSNSTLSWTDNASLWENKWGGLTKDISGYNMTVSLVISGIFTAAKEKSTLIFVLYLFYFFCCEKHLCLILHCAKREKNIYLFTCLRVTLCTSCFFCFVF